MTKSLFTKMRNIPKWKWNVALNFVGDIWRILEILRISKLLTCSIRANRKWIWFNLWWQVQWFRNRNSICRADAFNKWLMSHNHSYEVETSVSTVNTENELEKQNYEVDIKRQCETMLPNRFTYFLLTTQKVATYSKQISTTNWNNNNRNQIWRSSCVLVNSV